jgi:excinuclease UvrABC nuclease subunit
MRKVTKMPLVLIGKLGNVYEFTVYDINSELCSTGGVYVYIDLEDSDLFVRSPDLVYCGKTNDLRRRHNEHCLDDEDMVNSSNCICFLPEDDEDERMRIETDILLRNHFQYNDQLN